MGAFDMLRIYDQPTRLCDGLSRREWLSIGGLTTLGLSLPALLHSHQAHAKELRPSGGKAKSCILLFHGGGPPQMETWDMKPEAPVEIRGPYQPIATNVTGIQVCELMPRTARHLEKIAVLRAVSTDDNAHSASGYWMLTGRPHQPKQVENARPGAPNDWPSIAAIVRRLRKDGPLPSSMVIPENIWNDGNIPWPGQDGGFLGRSADPWFVTCDPNAANFEIPGISLPNDIPDLRMKNRLTLLDQLDNHLDTQERNGRIARHDAHTQQAYELLRAGKARKAFRLDEESDRLRDRYGRNRWGQSVLLARRLVEAGVGLVQVNWTRMKEDQGGSPVWDTHAKNAERLKNHLMPIMDMAYSALLEDLAVRGLLDETLVVWAGEFGRTPKINGNGGRDHWGPVFSVALAGGGIKGGQVYGSSDKIAGYPKDNKVLPEDLTATIFHSLGHHPDTEIHDTLGRPLPISRGRVIQTVL